MKITGISRQTKRNDRYNVYVDETFVFSLSVDDLIGTKIARGDTINNEKLSALRKISAESLLLDNALRYMSSRPHSIKEVKTYLKQKILKKEELKKLPEEQRVLVIETILNHLLNKKYLNDNEFAEWFVKQRLASSKPKGQKFIEMELYQKGIDHGIVSKVISTIDIGGEIKRAKLLASKKYKLLINQGRDEQKIKQILITHLHGKGYQWNIIKTAVDSILPHYYNNKQ